jgi:zinc protease
MIRIIIALGILFISASTAFARDAVLNIQEVTSPGGIKAWLVEDHSVPVIALNFGFKGAGTLLDPADKQGLARMVSNTMDEGAGDLDAQAFQKELRDQSISLSFSATRDDFTGSVKTVNDHKDRAFELLKLALTQPRFEAEAIERMREANESRIRSSLSDPDWIAARILNDTIFEGHVYAQNSGGTLSTLKAITAEDIKAFHKNYLGKNNLVVAVAGDVTADELGRALDAVFGDLPVVTLPPVPAVKDQKNTGSVFLYSKDIPQSIIQIVQPGIDHRDPDYHLAQVMNFVLGSSGFGSRLTEEIREKRGLTYGIYSSFMSMRYFDGLSVNTSTENKNAGTMLDLIKKEWATMKAAPITAKELQDAQTYLIGSLPLSLTSTDDIADLMLGLRLDELPIDYLDAREQAIRSATPADILRVATKILDPDKMTVILVGKPEGVPEATTITTIPNAE